MTITVILNGAKRTDEVQADTTLFDYLRSHGCLSVKCGCETSSCGLCSVHLDGKPVLSCSVPAVRADGRTITTLEGLQEEAAEFGVFLADEGAEQCGYCSPGFIMSVLAMAHELKNPRGRHPGLSGGQPVPVLRLPGSAAGDSEVFEGEGRGQEMSVVSTGVRKKDAMILEPVFTSD